MAPKMEQTRNDTKFLPQISWKVSGKDRYPTGSKRVKYPVILTNLENQMEQPELSPCHLIYVQVSIVSSLLRERLPSITKSNKERNPWSILYHENTAVGLASSLLKVRHKLGPHTDNVPDDLTQRRHWEVSGHSSTFQSMSGCHPVSVLSAF